MWLSCEKNQILWVILITHHEMIRSGPLKVTSVRADPAFKGSWMHSETS